MKTDLIAKLILLTASTRYVMITRDYTSIAVVFAVVYLAFKRDFYLPFLGKCVFPVSNTPQGKDGLVRVTMSKLPANVKLLYWAAKPNKGIFADPFVAYDDYSNMGTTMTDNDGNATVVVQCPGSYNVNKFGVWKKTISAHLHYRYELLPYKGMFSRVYTTDLQANCAK